MNIYNLSRLDNNFQDCNILFLLVFLDHIIMSTEKWWIKVFWPKFYDLNILAYANVHSSLLQNEWNKRSLRQNPAFTTTKNKIMNRSQIELILLSNFCQF